MLTQMALANARPEPLGDALEAEVPLLPRESIPSDDRMALRRLEEKPLTAERAGDSSERGTDDAKYPISMELFTSSIDTGELQ